MIEADDRLAGDPVWELFAHPAVATATEAQGVYRYWHWLTLAAVIAVSWFLIPPLAVVIACLAAAVRDCRNGRRLARSIPDKAGGAVCARFTYAWGAWKVALAGFGLMFATVILAAAVDPRRAELLPASMAAMLLCMGGFLVSALLTASGLLKAYRSGMRVWVGEGVNQARTLLLSMLLVGFTLLVLMPMMLWLVGRIPRASDSRHDNLALLLMFLGCLIGAPLVILAIVDWLGRRVIADRPGKFGPKVPSVGKWSA
jgi:hypothetical protein